MIAKRTAKIWVAALLLFSWCRPALARQSFAGYCDQSGVTVTAGGLNVAPVLRVSYPGCTVTIYLAGTTTIATIYSDAVGTSKSNPFTADATTGRWSFYADVHVDVRLSGAGIATPFTLGDYSPIITTFDVGSFAGADLGAKTAACLAVLPSTGGICDARNFTGTQASSIDPLSGFTKPYQVLVGDYTIQDALPWTFQGAGQSIIGTSSTYGYGLGTGCSGGTVFQPTAGFTGAGVIRFDPTGSSSTGVEEGEVRHVCFDMTNKPTQTVISATATLKATLDDLHFSNYAGTLLNSDPTIWAGTPVRSNEMISIRNWRGWPLSGTTEQAAPLFRFIGISGSEGSLDDYLEDVFVVCSHASAWASNANSIGIDFEGNVGGIHVVNSKIGSCAKSVRMANYTGATSAPVDNWIAGLTIEAAQTGFDLAGGANNYVKGNFITEPSLTGLVYSDLSIAKTAWVANTVHALNDTIIPTTTGLTGLGSGNATGLWYQATGIGAVPHQTGATEPTWPTVIGNSVIDGNITWTAEGRVPTTFWLGGSVEYNTLRGGLNDNADHVGIVYGGTAIGDNWVIDPGGPTGGRGYVVDPGAVAINDIIESRTANAVPLMERALVIESKNAGSGTIDAGATNYAYLNLTGNVTVTVSNPTDGEVLTIDAIQDGAGGHTVTWPSNFYGVGVVVATANYDSWQRFRYWANTNAWIAESPMYFQLHTATSGNTGTVGIGGAIFQSGAAGAASVIASGTNQNITLTPTGTGVTVVGMPGIVGSYNAANIQCLWSVGTSLTCNTGANSLSTLYGLAWSFSGGGGSGIGTLSDHELILAKNGAIGTELGLGGTAKFGAGVGVGTAPPATGLTVSGLTTSTSFGTATNCSSSASPAVCGSAAAGSVAIANPATTIVVNTTAVTANSQILVMEDSSLGTKLAVTCNASLGRTYMVTARTAATSFTITASATPAANSACLSYVVVN